MKHDERKRIVRIISPSIDGKRVARWYEEDADPDTLLGYSPPRLDYILQAHGISVTDELIRDIDAWAEFHLR